MSQTTAAGARTAESYESEISLLREKLSDALTCGLQHQSSCAVYAAPAEEPSACTCGVAAAADDKLYDIVQKIRNHNGWRRTYETSEAINLIYSFMMLRGRALEKTGASS